MNDQTFLEILQRLTKIETILEEMDKRHNKRQNWTIPVIVAVLTAYLTAFSAGAIKEKKPQQVSLHPNKVEEI